MISRTQSDRQFTRDVGISTPCEMCDLLHIDNQRQRETTLDREIRLTFLIRLMLHHKQTVNMWKLATLVGFIWGALMTYASLHHG